MNRYNYCWDEPHPPGFLNVGLILKNAARGYPEKEIINGTADRGRTYKEMDERANRVANGLLEERNPGDFIGILMRLSTLEILETYFAIARAGMVYVPIRTRLSPKEMENVLQSSDAQALIYDENFKSETDQIDLEIDRYCVGGETEDPSYDELLQHDPTTPNVEIEDDTPVTLGFTSGTTGDPKGFLRTHYANFLNHLIYATTFDMTYQDVSLNAVPPVTGLSWDAGVMLAKGKVINIDFDPTAVLEAIEKYNVSVMYGVPTMYAMMLMVEDIESYDLSSLRAVASVGAPLQQSTLQGIREKITPNVYDHIGLQETGFVAVSKPDMKKRKPKAVGPPTSLHDIKIIDEEGNEKPAGETGRLAYKYPDGAGEYWQNEEANQESFQDGWFVADDLAKVDEDGYLYVGGRTRDKIVSGGYNVMATEVEEILMGNPKVVDCAVIGLPDEKWGEKVTAVIKLSPGETGSEEEFISYCEEEMASYMVPKSVFFDDIPRTPTGKAKKHELIEKYKEK